MTNNNWSEIQYHLLDDTNVDILISYVNERMKTLFGVDNWVERSKIQLSSLYGKSLFDAMSVIAYIDRDSGEEYFEQS